MYKSLHVEIYFIRVKLTGRRTVPSWSIKMPAGRLTVRSADLQTQTGARTICDHARKQIPEKCLKSSGARAIFKLAGNLQIAEIVRRHFLWSYSTVTTRRVFFVRTCILEATFAAIFWRLCRTCEQRGRASHSRLRKVWLCGRRATITA